MVVKNAGESWKKKTLLLPFLLLKNGKAQAPFPVLSPKIGFSSDLTRFMQTVLS